MAPAEWHCFTVPHPQAFSGTGSDLHICGYRANVLTKLRGPARQLQDPFHLIVKVPGKREAAIMSARGGIVLPQAKLACFSAPFLLLQPWRASEGQLD